MKKLLTIAFLLCAYMLAMADSWTDSNGINWSFTVSGVNAIDVKPSDEFERAKISGDVVIPSKIYSYTVTSIARNAFHSCHPMTSITIPESVTTIGNNAFYNCDGLTSLIIPSNVTSIGENTFSGCISLASVIIPPSVTTIGDKAFNGCVSLTSVIINNNTILSSSSSLKDIFGNQVENYVIGDDVTNIGSYAFGGCSGMTSLTIPSSVTNIGRYAFGGCSGLTKVIVPDIAAWCNITFEDASDNPIYYAHHLYSDDVTEVKDLVIPESVTEICSYLFSGCSGLTSVTIPNSVTSIGTNAFSSCSGLTSVTIPNSVTSIGTNAFSGCSGLTSVTIPNSVTSIGTNAFSGCSDLTSITIFSNHLMAKSYSSSSSLIAFFGNQVKEYIIGDGVTSIGSYAFSGCSGLKSVIVPSSLVTIGSDAFRECSGLTKVIVPDIAAWCNISFENSYANPFIYAHHLYCDEVTEIKELVIPEGVTSINPSAFYCCFYLTGLTIPSSVTSIGSNAFNDCYSLTSVTIPSSVTSIGSYAFNDCSGITSLIIPSSVTSIGSYAFHGCSSLTKVIIPSSVTSIGSYAFHGCSSLTKVIIPDIASWCNITFGDATANPLSVGHHLYSDEVTEVKDLVIPESVTEIRSYSFSGCSDLTSVTIPNSVISIKTGAFANCTSMTSVTIPNSMKSIGLGAFQNCTGLNSVHISDLTAWCNISFWSGGFSLNGYSLGNPLEYAHHLFINGNEIKDLVIPDGMTNIGSSVFYGCSGLTSVTIPSSVTSIDSYAFHGCSGLTKVIVSDIATWCNYSFRWYYENPLYYAHHLFINENEISDLVIPESVDRINPNAFYGCTSIKSVTIPSTIESIGSNAFYGCELESVTVNIEEPLIIDSETWANSNFMNAILFVPYGCKNAYQSATVWKDFKSIVEIDPNPVITFADPNVKAICVAKWDVTGDGELSTVEASAVTTLSGAFKGKTDIVSFNELRYFTGLTSIESYAFSSCSGLTSISLPHNLTNIGDYAFSGCFGLLSITISDNVTSIGKNAFYGCSSLTSVKIPNNVTNLSNSVFSGCSSLLSIIIPNSVTNIESNAFSWCSSLTSITIPNSVTSIESNVFSECSSLASIVIPNSVTSIGSSAFSGCTNLVSVTIPNSVTSIGGSAFAGCTRLVSIVVSEENTVYDSRQHCNAIITSSTNQLIVGCKNTIIPNSVTSIGVSAFYNCTGLASISIPNSVTSIGGSAFAYCTGLASISIPNSVTSIVDNTFSDCTSLTSITIPNSVTSIGNYAFSGCTGLSSIVIPNSVTSIGRYAFNKCAGLSSIVIPNSVTNIGDLAFMYCTGLTSVTVQWENPIAIDFSVFLSSNQANATLYVPLGSKDVYQAANNWKVFKEIVEIVTPSPVIIFADAAVKALCVENWDTNGDGELSEAEAAAVTDIGTVFQNNTQITSFDEISSFTGLTSIASQAFNGCTGLTSITIPENITSIGMGAFKDCTGLTKAEFASIEDLCSMVFEDYGANPLVNAHHLYINGEEITELVIPNSVTTIGTFAFRGCSSLTSATIPNSVTEIGVGIFSDCTALASVSLPENLTKISVGMFYGCKNLASIIIPEGVTSIGRNAFYGCSSLTSLTIPEGVTSIEDLTFFGCSSLTSLTIPEGVTSIGSSAFLDCSSLTSLTIPEGVTIISGAAFKGCSSLTSLTIPEGVTSIGSSAFNGCSSLTSVYVKMETPPAIKSTVFSNRANATLYVPYGCSEAYEATAYWNEFKKIVEMGALETDIAAKVGMVLPWGTEQAWEMKYMFFVGTDSEPEADGSGHDWYEEEYDDESWETLSGPIANISDWFSSVNTLWNTEGHESSSYCLRRTFHLDEVDEQGYTFLSQHDDDLKVWINGELVVDAGFDGTLHCHHIPASKFREGDNTLAISINDFGGEAYLDYSMGHLFFLQNVETEKYLNAGNEWGTHAVLADEPLPVQLYKQLDGSYTIFFPVRSYNQHLLFMDESMSDVYVDYAGQEASACPYWNITDAGNGNYYIQMLNESDTYLGNDPDREPDNDVDGDVTSGKNITWTLVPEGLHTQAQAERLQELITQANALHIDTNKAQAVLDDENSTYTEMLAQILQVDGWINEGIWFEDEKVKELCVANWDTSEDGELSRIEAGTVADLGEVFKGNTEITSFNELQYFTGLTAIGDRAFSESSHLTSVQLPEGLERIGESAFDRTGLETIHFPVTLTSVGATAFQACENLTSIDFNGCTATIEGDAFSWCPSLTEVVIPSNITLTGWFTFAGCRNLKTLIIEEGNPSENLQATFAYCFDSSLETLVLPSTAIMGENMFEGCSKLKSVTFLSGDPGEKHFANNFQGVPDDVLFVIPEGTAESYLKRGYRNLSDKGALGKVRELFENQVNRISNDIVANVADGDKDALNAAISAAREIVETAEDYMTIYQQIDAIKDAAKAYLATATLTALTEDLDVTGAMITNPDNDYFDIGWTIGFLGVNNGWQVANYSNEDCTIDSFVESWRPSEVLNDGKHSQTIKNLPAGKYRLDVKAIATWQDDPEQEVTGVCLFMGDQSTPLATANEKPQFFSVEFTNEETQDVEIGLKVENTTANWVALDDVRLYLRVGKLPGDANGDGYVTIADVMAVVDYILGNTPKDFDFDAANVNNDEVITIADAVSLVNMILEMP